MSIPRGVTKNFRKFPSISLSSFCLLSPEQEVVHRKILEKYYYDVEGDDRFTMAVSRDNRAEYSRRLNMFGKERVYFTGRQKVLLMDFVENVSTKVWIF